MYKDKKVHVENSTRWNKENPEKRKLIILKYDLKTKYNLTLDDYNKMFHDQGGACSICKVHQKDLKYRLHVDHCHTTGKVRGLLCKNCNTLLGRVKDDVSILDAAKQYLNDWS